MNQSRQLLIIGLLAAGLAMTGCGKKAEDQATNGANDGAAAPAYNAEPATETVTTETMTEETIESGDDMGAHGDPSESMEYEEEVTEVETVEETVVEE